MQDSLLVNERRKYTMVGMLALILWASSLPFIKRCSEDLGPFTTALLMYFSGGVIGLFANAFIFKKVGSAVTFFKNKEFYYRVTLFSVYFFFFYNAIGAVEREDLPILTLVNYLWPTFTMLLSVFILRQGCSKILLAVGSIVVFIGLGIEILGERFFVLLSSEQSRATLEACLLMFIAAFCWGFYTVMNRKWGSLAGEIEGLPFVMLLSSVVLIVLRFAYHETSNITEGMLFPAVYLMFAPYLANLCWDIGTRKGNIVLLSLFADALPWASLTITALYLGINIGKETWISAVVIVVGALISRYSLLVKQKR